MELHVIDFDGVLFDQHRTHNVYPEAIDLIKSLKFKGKYLCIATRRSEEEAREMIDILKSAGVHDVFEIIIDNPCSKVWHIRQILKHLKDKYPETIFHPTLYDDFDVNIQDIIKAGYKGVLINNRYGLRFQDIQ